MRNRIGNYRRLAIMAYICKQMDKQVEDFIDCIWAVFVSPVAFILLMLMALLKILHIIFKATLLFTIAAMYTPFAVIYCMALLVFEYKLQLGDSFCMSSFDETDGVDPRASVGIEFRIIVSNFFKVVAGELLVVLSTGVITFYTAPILVYYVFMAGGLAAILLKWLNTRSISKTAFSCLCDCYGLNPMMFLFSFLGLFDIGCHPIAKCSFVAKKAYLFTNDNPTQFPDEVTNTANRSIKFPWNAFESSLYLELCPRIDFINRDDKKYILKSFMVLKLFGVKLCDYPVERLELPEDYTKILELLNFLEIVSTNDGFVTDKMRGRYEHSLTLLEIVDGVGQYAGYRTVNPRWDAKFVVAGYTV